MKVLISSRSFGKIDSGAIELLKNEGLNPILNPYGKKLNEQEILDLLDDSVGIIAGTEKITEKIITQNSQLKVISRYGIGLDNIDLKVADQKNVIVFNTPETPKIAVAELTITLILSLLKKVIKVDKTIKKGEWQPEIGNLLSGKTIGIIGVGRVGKQLVQFLSPFNVKILAYEIKPDELFVSKNKINLVSLEDLICKSDIITIHCPLTEKTRHIIGEKELKNIKESAILINTARGGLIDELALYQVLKEKKIAGAAIDAFEDEPNTGKLKELDNVILTPHLGSYTIETRKQMEIEAAENLIKGLKMVKIL
jgi:D-3-phosphoglycerate dehydrogenase